MKIKVSCNKFLVVYKLSKNSHTGKADIFVDGKKIKTVNGYDKDGWNNARIVLAINEEAKKVHTIEIRMAKGTAKRLYGSSHGISLKMFDQYFNTEAD